MAGSSSSEIYIDLTVSSETEEIKSTAREHLTPSSCEGEESDNDTGTQSVVEAEVEEGSRASTR